MTASLTDLHLVSETAALVPVSVFGVQATACCQVDQVEHQRRRGRGLGGVTRFEWLETMLDLPVGMPVPWPSLNRSERRLLARLPAGCLDWYGTSVIRRLMPPLRVELAVVGHDDWRQGLKAASRFACYCARALILRGVPADLVEARTWADYYGIGLIITDDSDDAHVAVVPERFVPETHNAAGWEFLETVYQAFTTAEDTTPPGTA